MGCTWTARGYVCPLSLAYSHYVGTPRSPPLRQMARQYVGFPLQEVRYPSGRGTACLAAFRSQVPGASALLCPHRQRNAVFPLGGLPERPESLGTPEKYSTIYWPFYRGQDAVEAFASAFGRKDAAFLGSLQWRARSKSCRSYSTPCVIKVSGSFFSTWSWRLVYLLQGVRRMDRGP